VSRPLPERNRLLLSVAACATCLLRNPLLYLYIRSQNIAETRINVYRVPNLSGHPSFPDTNNSAFPVRFQQPLE
jgi:hypothetical protein